MSARPASSGLQSVHSAGMSDRLPSGKTTRTRRTPRRRMLLITASDWPSKAWRSRVIVAESGTSRRWVVCGCFLIGRHIGFTAVEILGVDLGRGLALHQFTVDVKAAFLHLNFVTRH